MKNNKDRNYLDYIPVRNNEYEWNMLEDGIIEIDVVNKGLFNKIAQTFFKAPKVSKIKLDEYGSLVWKSIDDKRDIGDIAQKIRNSFEDEETVFYSRLIKFFQILKENKFIKYRES
ncbi:MAG: PqqD family protein [Clostridium sp.]|nr:PqqD family protein [Clostridium sp.]